MKRLCRLSMFLVPALALGFPAMAAEIPAEVTLFRNVGVFDGKNETLLEGYDVLVVRNLIKKAAKDIPTEGTYELNVNAGGMKDGRIYKYTIQ